MEASGPRPPIGEGANGRPTDTSAPTGKSLAFAVAADLDQVLRCWELVYQAYTRSGLIELNAQHIHTVPEAIGPNTTVIFGQVRGEVFSTLTMIHDSDTGLPIQRVYGSEVDALRGAGRKLMEVGLFADRREQLTRSLPAVLEMMRYVFYRSRFSGHNDIVIGVHPHHAAFYEKYFGFEKRGGETVHPTVRNHPVVFLHLDLEAKLQFHPLHKGLAMYVTQPLPADTFDQRYTFDSEGQRHPRIEGFLNRIGKGGQGDCRDHRSSRDVAA